MIYRGKLFRLKVWLFAITFIFVVCLSTLTTYAQDSVSALFMGDCANTLIALNNEFDTQSFNRAFTHHTAEVNGVQIHYVMGGQGEPLVLMHGFLGSRYAWRKVMPTLAEHYTVIAPDLRADYYSVVSSAITEADLDEYVRTYSMPNTMRSAFSYYRALPEDVRQN